MKLNIVYGRSGTGKSEYIYKDIIKKINKKYIYYSSRTMQSFS